jgi:hypothetical protein
MVGGSIPRREEIIDLRSEKPPVPGEIREVLCIILRVTGRPTVSHPDIKESISRSVQAVLPKSMQLWSVQRPPMR